MRKIFFIISVYFGLTAHAEIVCITGFGTELTISNAEQTITYFNKFSQTGVYRILQTKVRNVGNQRVSTYTTDSGERLVIEFRTGAKNGSGSWLLANGQRYSEFQKCTSYKR